MQQQQRGALARNEAGVAGFFIFGAIVALVVASLTYAGVHKATLPFPRTPHQSPTSSDPPSTDKWRFIRAGG